MDDIVKKAKSLKESSLLIKCVNVAIKSKSKEQKGKFLGVLLGTLAAILLGKLLTGKGLKRSKTHGQGNDSRQRSNRGS